MKIKKKSFDAWGDIVMKAAFCQVSMEEADEHYIIKIQKKKKNYQIEYVKWLIVFLQIIIFVAFYSTQRDWFYIKGFFIHLDWFFFIMMEKW